MRSGTARGLSQGSVDNLNQLGIARGEHRAMIAAWRRKITGTR
jgi:hypothetical protein